MRNFLICLCIFIVMAAVMTYSVAEGKISSFFYSKPYYICISDFIEITYFKCQNLFLNFPKLMFFRFPFFMLFIFTGPSCYNDEVLGLVRLFSGFSTLITWFFFIRVHILCFVVREKLLSVLPQVTRCSWSCLCWSCQDNISRLAWQDYKQNKICCSKLDQILILRVSHSRCII